MIALVHIQEEGQKDDNLNILEIKNEYLIGKYTNKEKVKLKPVKNDSLALKAVFDKNWKNFNTSNNENIIPKIKKRLDTVTEKLKSYYYEDNRATSEELNNLFGGRKVFNNPKSINFLCHIIQFAVNKKALICDFFAGSASTAHAAMQLNAEDGGNRRYIMVQWDEPTWELDKNGKKIPKKDNQSAKVAFDAGYMSIDQIFRDRIKYAGAKILKEYNKKKQQTQGNCRSQTKQNSLNGIKTLALSTTSLLRPM